MDRDTVIELAREAGFMQHLGVIAIPNIKNLERFAALVAAAEREECAKVCEAEAELYDDNGHGWIADQVAQECAAAIRARGNT